jgi:hypothetical protein
MDVGLKGSSVNLLILTHKRGSVMFLWTCCEKRETMPTHRQQKAFSVFILCMTLATENEANRNTVSAYLDPGRPGETCRQRLVQRCDGSEQAKGA